MRPAPTAHLDAHRHSSHHRTELLASGKCGCFYCLAIFEPTEITEWIDEPHGLEDASRRGNGQTALCPKCRIDSVIGDKSGYPLNEHFLRRMHAHWFSTE